MTKKRPPRKPFTPKIAVPTPPKPWNRNRRVQKPNPGTRRCNREKGIHIIKRGSQYWVTGTRNGYRYRWSLNTKYRDEAEHRLMLFVQYTFKYLNGDENKDESVRQKIKEAIQNGKGYHYIEKSMDTRCRFEEAVDVYCKSTKKGKQVSKSSQEYATKLLDIIPRTTLCADIDWAFIYGFRDDHFESVQYSTFYRQFVAPAKAVLNCAALHLTHKRGCHPPIFEKLGPQEGRTIILDPDQAEQIVRLASGDGEYTFVAAFVFALTEGGRRSDIAQVAWENVRLDRGYFVFRDVKAATGVVRDRRVDEPHPRTMQILREYAEFTGRREGRIFLDESGKPFPDVGRFGAFMNPRLRQYAKKVGHPDADEVTLHVLRHSFASWLYRISLDIFYVKKRGDWRSDTAVKRYIHELHPSHADGARRFFGLA